MPILTAEQVIDWQTFRYRNGLPHYRDDIHFGLLSSLIYNANRGENSVAEAPLKFMPWHDPYEDEVSVDDWKAKIKGLNKVCP